MVWTLASALMTVIGIHDGLLMPQVIIRFGETAKVSCRGPGKGVGSANVCSAHLHVWVGH